MRHTGFFFNLYFGFNNLQKYNTF